MILITIITILMCIVLAATVEQLKKVTEKLERFSKAVILMDDAIDRTKEFIDVMYDQEAQHVASIQAELMEITKKQERIYKDVVNLSNRQALINTRLKKVENDKH